MCPNCRAFITTDDKICPYCDVKVGPKAIDLRPSGAVLGGLIPQARFTTVMILVINFALFGVDMLASGSPFRSYGASVPWPYLHGEWWRLVTAGFLHGNLIHIGMNSLALYSVGAEVEALCGTSRLIVFYFVSTITGFLLSSMTGHFSVGSSAAIFGLIGAMLAFGFTDKSSLGAMVKAHYGQWVIFALIMSFIPGVDIFAHIGGLAGGFVTFLILGMPRARLMWKEPVIRYAAFACIGLTALCLGRLVMAVLQTPA